jgi:hypothetical protein
MRAGFGKPPPLSRVTEEAVPEELQSAVIQPSKLVEVETPRESQEFKNTRVSTLARSESDLIKLTKDKGSTPSEVAKDKQPQVVDESMREIEI